MVPNKNTTMPTKLLERPSSHKLSCSPAKIMTRAFGEHYDMGGPNSEHSEDPWARGEHEPGVKDPCHKLSRLSPGLLAPAMHQGPALQGKCPNSSTCNTTWPLSPLL